MPAEDPLARKIAQLIRAEGRAEQGPTFAELWARYYRAEGRGNDTAADIARHGRALCDAFGDRRALSLRAADMEDFRDERAQTVTRLGGPPSDSSVNRQVAQARRCMQWGVENQEIPFNPIASVRMAKEHNVRKSKIRTEEELSRLLAFCDPWMHALVLLFIDSGLRRMEGITLQWKQIGMVRGDDGEYAPVIELWNTKNERRRRVGVSQRTFDAIWSLPRLSRYVFPGRRPGVRNWTNQNVRSGAHLTPDALLKRFKKIVAKADLHGVDDEPITFHTLRHSFAYLMRVVHRVSESETMEQGGWLTRSAFERYGIGDEHSRATMYRRVNASITAEVNRMRVRRPPQPTVPDGALRMNKKKSTPG